MTTARRIRLTIFLGVLAALAPLSTDMYLPALPELKLQLGVDTSTIQMTLSMTMLGMGVGQIFAGPISDRFGRKLPLVFGMLCFTAATIGCMRAIEIELFLALRFLQGLSGSFGIVIARAIARDVATGDELTRFFSMLMLVNGLAPILSPIIGGLILLVMNWRGIFAMMLLVGSLIFASTLFFSETLPASMRTKDISASFKNFGVLLKDKYFVGHCLMQCAALGAFFSYLTGSAFLFQEIYHVSPQTYSWIFSGLGASLVVAGSIPMFLAGRVKNIKMLRWAVLQALIGSVAFLLCVLVAAPMELTVLSLLIMIPTLSVLGATSFSLSMRLHGKEAGTAAALVGFSQMFFAGLVSPLVGIAGSDTAVPMALIILICQALAVGIFFKMIFSFHARGAKIIHGS